MNILTKAKWFVGGAVVGGMTWLLLLAWNDETWSYIDHARDLAKAYIDGTPIKILYKWKDEYDQDLGNS